MFLLKVVEIKKLIIKVHIHVSLKLTKTHSILKVFKIWGISFRGNHNQGFFSTNQRWYTLNIHSYAIGHFHRINFHFPSTEIYSNQNKKLYPWPAYSYRGIENRKNLHTLYNYFCSLHACYNYFCSLHARYNYFCNLHTCYNYMKWGGDIIWQKFP